ATRELTLPTTVTGSWPRPSWFTEVLRGRAFKDALGDSRFREQYLDAVSCIVKEQETAGLDIVTDGDSRFDLTVGGKSWFFYHRAAPRHYRPRGPLGERRLDHHQAGADPLRGDGGVSARSGRREAARRPAAVRRPLQGGAALRRAARQVRFHQRPDH